MRLKELRQHYKRSKGVWIPKQAYMTKVEAEKALGLHPTSIYRCKICNYLHTSKRKQGSNES